MQKQSFRRKRRRNQATRFLTKRQAALHPSNYNSGGNRAVITLKDKSQ